MWQAVCRGPANSLSDLSQELCCCSEALPCVLSRLTLLSSWWLLHTIFILSKFLSLSFPLILSRPLCLQFNEQARSPDPNHFIPPTSQASSKNYLAVKWLGLCALNTKGLGSIPAQGTRTVQAATWPKSSPPKTKQNPTISISHLPHRFLFLTQQTRDPDCWPRLCLASVPSTLSGSTVA